MPGRLSDNVGGPLPSHRILTQAMAHPFALVAAQTVSLWPIWQWYVRRVADGSDEPWGLVALGAVLLLLWGERRNLRPGPRPAVLLGAGLLTVLSAVSGHCLPPLLRALLGVSALGLTLAAVLLLLGLGVKLLRRWPNLMGRDGCTAGLQVVGRVALAPKESIYLVRAGAEVLVVGVSPSGITLLSRLEAGGLEATRTPMGANESWGSSLGRTGVDRAYSRGARSAPGKDSGAHSSIGSRLRELVLRIRDVQAAWGLRNPPQRSEP